MQQTPEILSRPRPRQKHGRPSLKREIRRIRDSKRRQKQLKQLVVIAAAVVIAFVLGYFFFGPSFSSGE